MTSREEEECHMAKTRKRITTRRTNPRPKTPRPRQPTDLTLRNLHAVRKDQATITDAVDDLKGRVAVLEAFMEEQIQKEVNAEIPEDAALADEPELPLEEPQS
jgi:hypothetical protein